MNKELAKYLRELISKDSGVAEEEINNYLAGRFGSDAILETDEQVKNKELKQYLDDKFPRE